MTEYQFTQLAKRAIGPLDKRGRTTRCQSCAKRRKKCEGGSPCKRCIQLNSVCIPQQNQHRGSRFVHIPARNAPILPVQVPKHESAIYLDHFASFLRRCQFSKSFTAIHAELVDIIGDNPLLLHIASAIGALDASQKPFVRSLGDSGSPRQIAFRECGISMQKLNLAILMEGQVFREDLLWCTFLHGLFELIAENSGDSFAKHMAYGTSKILLLLKPTDSISPSTKGLIDAIWVLENHRAILYGDNPLLSQDTHSSISIRKNKPSFLNKIITIMVKTSTFAKRLFDTIESIPEESRPLSPTLNDLALEGIKIKQKLDDWKQKQMLEESLVDPYACLATITHSALVLYHCRNFSFYSCWMTRTIPRIDQDEINEHVSTILSFSKRVISGTCIPGVLLLFPLRMAGAHAYSSRGQEAVLDIIRQVQRKGFIVSDRIEADLQGLWNSGFWKGSSMVVSQS